jgi:hypothetical protein
MKTILEVNAETGKSVERKMTVAEETDYIAQGKAIHALKNLETEKLQAIKTAKLEAITKLEELGLNPLAFGLAIEPETEIVDRGN